MKLRKRMAGAGGLGMIAIAAAWLCSCGAGDHSDRDEAASVAGIGGQDRVVLNFVYSGREPTAKAALSEAVEGFLARHPEVEIVQDTSGTGSYLDYLQMKDVTGEFPDMMEMLDTQAYAEAGRLARMPDDLVALVDRPTLIDGAVYALPMTGQTPSGFIYNKEIFEQAGIEREPRTWEEFLAACEKIKQLGIAPIVVGGKDVWHIGLLLNKLLMDHVYADEPDWNAKRTRGETSFTDDAVVEALEEYAELFRLGYVNEDWQTTSDSQTSTVLLSRKAAMLYTGASLMNPILKADPYFRMGYFVPGDSQGRLVLDTLPRQAGLAMSAETAADPKKLQAFKAFVNYFYSPEAYAEYLGGSALPFTAAGQQTELSEAMRQAAALSDRSHLSALPMDAYWGDDAMPPAFADWYYRQIRQWVATGKPTIGELTARSDQEWDRLSAIRAEFSSAGSSQ